MLKILWKRREIAPEEQFLLLSTIFCYLMLDFYVKTRIRFSLRDKRLFKITEVEITTVDCTSVFYESVKASIRSCILWLLIRVYTFWKGSFYEMLCTNVLLFLRTDVELGSLTIRNNKLFDNQKQQVL